MKGVVVLRAVVTGISQGIGAATALALARQGAKVAGVHRDSPELSDEVASAIDTAGGEAFVEVADVADAARLDTFADEVVRRWGGIDLWVNNAARQLIKPFLATTQDDWAGLLGVNLLGVVNGCRAAARHMVPAGAGRIVNVSSVVATQPLTDATAYTTAKGGIDALTRALAVELGEHGITVNAIAPSARTRMSEAVLGEMARPNDGFDAMAPENISPLVVWLGSDKSRDITGREIGRASCRERVSCCV